MSNFINLHDIIQSFKTDPETMNDPVKRMFICGGESISVNIAINPGDKIHHVRAGDLMFIPRNTLHGKVRLLTGTISVLSIYAPHFDHSKTNIIWDKDRKDKN